VDGITTGSTAVQEVWTQEFPIDQADDRTIPKVCIGGLVYKRDSSSNQEYLIVAGSTRGQGNGYGAANGDDEDGFITVLDPVTGALHTGTTINKNNIREGTTEDDIVSGICDDPSDEQSFFVVGATKGTNLGTQQADSSIIGQLPAGSLQPFYERSNWLADCRTWLSCGLV
jgi:hypothetical protein